MVDQLKKGRWMRSSGYEACLVEGRIRHVLAGRRGWDAEGKPWKWRRLYIASKVFVSRA